MRIVTPAKAEQSLQDEKAARREQRRSTQESGDYLGVQGANPRTGYWDISDRTTTDPSQISEETKRKLDEKGRKVDEQKKYEEAQAKHQSERRNVLIIKEMKKKEKAQQKRIEMKVKQSRYGKWKLGEGGWSSVVEPDLSPIEQSLAGSPVVGKFTALVCSESGWTLECLQS